MRTWVLALAVLLFSTTEAHAGWIITDASGAQVKLQSGRLRFEFPKLGAYIVDTERGTLTLVAEPLQAFATEKISRICRKIRRLANTNRVNAAPSRVSTSFVSKGGRIAGEATTIYDVFVDDQPHTRVWLTQSRPMRLDLGDFNFAHLVALERCGAGWTAITEEHLGTVSPVDASKAFQRLMRQGWIMKRVDLQTGEVLAEAREVEERVVKFDAFSPPKRYREMPMGKLLRMLAED
jgi:hypothetical protein